MMTAIREIMTGRQTAEERARREYRRLVVRTARAGKLNGADTAKLDQLLRELNITPEQADQQVKDTLEHDRLAPLADSADKRRQAAVDAAVAFAVFRAETQNMQNTRRVKLAVLTNRSAIRGDAMNAERHAIELLTRDRKPELDRLEQASIVADRLDREAEQAEKRVAELRRQYPDLAE